MSESDLIRPAVKEYVLKPYIVHTAPEPSSYILWIVVKSSPDEYYDELLDSYGPGPRRRELIAQHEMRQRIKAHFDEQRFFLSPDHGSLSYYAQTCYEWLLGRKSVGSALHKSIFFAAMHEFPNLRKLVFTYPTAREWPVFNTIAEDLSTGLGNYLVRNRRSQLRVLKIEQVHPSDLEILVSTIRCSNASLDQPQSPLQMLQSWVLGSWSAVSPSTSPSPTNLLALGITTLDILFPEVPRPGLAQPLSDILCHTVNLETLILRSPVSFDAFDRTPSLVELRAPPLPCLTHLTIEYLILDADGIVSLTIPNKARLKRVRLFTVGLQRGTWADVGNRFLAEMRRLRDVRGLSMARVGYVPADTAWVPSLMPAEERAVWEQW
ncbi:MAG: hypothetical protein Q9191_001899 [Dirinaria sp. TL-2023a]